MGSQTVVVMLSKNVSTSPISEIRKSFAFSGLDNSAAMLWFSSGCMTNFKLFELDELVILSKERLEDNFFAVGLHIIFLLRTACPRFRTFV